MKYAHAHIQFIFCAFLVRIANGQGIQNTKRCQTPTNLFGKCVHYSQCPSFMKFLTQRKLLTEEETIALRQYICGASLKNKQICCPEEDVDIDWIYNDCQTPEEEIGKCKPVDYCKPIIDYIKRPSNISTEIKWELRRYICKGGTATRPNVCCPHMIFSRMSAVDSEIVDHSSHRNIHLLPNTCGQQPGDNKIIRGTATAIYDFPWAVALQIQIGTTVKYGCGGSLINNRYVLTAAHCISSDKSQVVGVRLGEHNFGTNPDCAVGADGVRYCAPPYQDFEVTLDDTIVHANYNRTTFINDIALIRLRRPVNLTDAIAPVCLPITIQEKLNHLADIYTVIGWGTTANSETSKILMKAEVPVRFIKKCTGITLPNKQLCAGGVNATDACRGDSGGPLMADFLDDGLLKVIQYGIVSVGSRLVCGKVNVPTIYTKVAEYVTWILNHLQP